MTKYSLLFSLLAWIWRFQYQNLSGLGPFQPLLWGLEGFRCVFPLIFQKWGFWGIWGPQISGVLQISGVPQISGVVKSQFFGLKYAKNHPNFLGYPRILGFFWGWARPLEYSNIFYVSSRRFWILLVSDVVTHTYNTSERSYSHGDVYKRFFIVCRVTSRSHVMCHPKFLGYTPNFWGYPRNTPIFWDWPQFLGIKNVLPQICWCYPRFTPDFWGNPRFTPNYPRFSGATPKTPQKIGSKSAGSLKLSLLKLNENQSLFSGGPRRAGGGWLERDFQPKKSAQLKLEHYIVFVDKKEN